MARIGKTVAGLALPALLAFGAYIYLKNPETKEAVDEAARGARDSVTSIFGGSGSPPDSHDTTEGSGEGVPDSPGFWSSLFAALGAGGNVDEGDNPQDRAESAQEATQTRPERTEPDEATDESVTLNPPPAENENINEPAVETPATSTPAGHGTPEIETTTPTPTTEAEPEADPTPEAAPNQFPATGDTLYKLPTEAHAGPVAPPVTPFDIYNQLVLTPPPPPPKGTPPPPPPPPPPPKQQVRLKRSQTTGRRRR